MARNSKGSYFDRKSLWDSNINTCSAIKLIDNVIDMINADLMDNKNKKAFSSPFNRGYLGTTTYISLNGTTLVIL